MVENNQPNGNPNATEDNKAREQAEAEAKAKAEAEAKAKQEAEAKAKAEAEAKAKAEAEARAEADKVIIDNYEKKLADQKSEYEVKLKARDERIKQLIHTSVKDKPTDTPSIAEELNKKRACKKW